MSVNEISESVRACVRACVCVCVCAILSFGPRFTVNEGESVTFSTSTPLWQAPLHVDVYL